MITVEGLTKTYGPRRAIDNLSSTITCGRATGFVSCDIQCQQRRHGSSVPSSD